MSDRTDTRVPHVNIFDVPYELAPDFGGAKSVIYRSADGLRVAAAFYESGRVEFEFPFDEFIYVVAGHATFAVDGGETFDMDPGHACYFRTGQVVRGQVSDDYHAVVVLISSDSEIQESAPSRPGTREQP